MTSCLLWTVSGVECHHDVCMETVSGLRSLDWDEGEQITVAAHM